METVLKVALTFMLFYGTYVDGQTTGTPSSNTANKGNKVYRVTTILNEPFVTVGTTPGKPNSKFSGFIPELLDRISSVLNITFDIVHVGDGKYGSKDENGNWTGMIGELKNNKSDIAAAPLTVTAERAKHIHFSHPFMETGLRILVKKPQTSTPLKDEMFLVFKPFNFEIWVIIILAIIAVSVEFFIIGRYNPEEMLDKKDHVNLTLTNAFFFTFSMLTWQGYSVTPKSHSARILAAFWWLFAFITIVTYIANVTSLFLTRPPSGPVVPFYTFDELSKQSKIAYGYLKFGATSVHFQKSRGQTEQRIFNFVKENPTYAMKSNEMGIQMARTQDYAFIVESVFAEYAAAQTPCDLMVVGELLRKVHYSFACRPEIDVCRDLDIAVLQLKQNGEIDDMLLKHLSGTCATYKANMMCSLSEYGVPIKSDIDAVKSINMKRFAGPLILLFIGMLLSIIVLVLEIYCAGKNGRNYGRRIPEDKETFREPMDMEAHS